MTQIKRKINPQPIMPILSLFRGEEEYGPGSEGWWYQSPETFDEAPKITYNAAHAFADPNEPGLEGHAYEGGIIESVEVGIEDGVAYWIVELAAEGQ